MSFAIFDLGAHHIDNPLDGEPNYLSAASGVAWTGKWLYSVGDDQASLTRYELTFESVRDALYRNQASDLLAPGKTLRILKGKLPQDAGLRAEAKADFEALTMITRQHLELLPDDGTGIKEEAIMRYPNGMLLITGSGGMSWGGTRRSIGVVYVLDDTGCAIGGPTKIELSGLHEYLEEFLAPHVLGELNIEGTCVYNNPQGSMELILAQRGNCIDKKTSQPGENMLIRLSLLEVVRSILNDLEINALELLSVSAYNPFLGHIQAPHDGVVHDVKLDFTDLDAIAGDPYSRLIFTAAAEGTDGPFKGRIAGSAIGVIDANGYVTSITDLEDTSIKLEGITSWWNDEAQRIEFLAVDDADNPEKIAMLRGGYIS
jgi:hypothetical protein